MRTLILVLSDQLDRTAEVLETADPVRDAVCMTESDVDRGPSPKHKQRQALCLAAMRHFRDDLRAREWAVHYQTLDEPDGAAGAPDFLRRQITEHQPDRVAVTEPGRYGLFRSLEDVCAERGVPLSVHPDTHFLVTHDAFEEWAEGRKELTLEYFYREQRRAYDVLLTDDGKPVGGSWNFDDENRAAFGADGPGMIPHEPAFSRDETTKAVLDLVRRQRADAPGTLDDFIWPVTPEQAETALSAFIDHRLPRFGTYQDAMWTGHPFLYHSRLAAALNVKLLDPHAVIERVEAAYDAGEAPINAVEGFIRQVLGWREFVRGVYWLRMPDYAEQNKLEASADLPDFYWTGETQMRCLREAIGQVLDHGYTHHISRLMVIGLFALLYGVHPRALNDWHEAMYVDAWEWVSMPNVLGMALYADGGIVGTKPYTASGAYIDRMSNFCEHCRYNPGEATGDDACPITSLYWHFLDRHQDELASNRRMNFQLANVRRKTDEQHEAIARRVEALRARIESSGA